MIFFLVVTIDWIIMDTPPHHTHTHTHNPVWPEKAEKEERSRSTGMPRQEVEKIPFVWAQVPGCIFSLRSKSFFTPSSMKHYCYLPSSENPFPPSLLHPTAWVGFSWLIQRVRFRACLGLLKLPSPHIPLVWKWISALGWHTSFPIPSPEPEDKGVRQVKIKILDLLPTNVD